MNSSKPGLSRRTLLLSGSALVAATAGLLVYPRRTTAQGGADFAASLAIPALSTGQMDGGVRVFDLAVQDGVTTFFEGLQTATRGVNGSYLGPTLRMRRGETVRLNVRNTLAEPTTLHWHGMNVPAAADGGPHQVVVPGAVWSPEFALHEVASTMWYHSHLMGGTARQVWQGLAGMIIIDDDASAALGLPTTYGVDDFPVVLQDRRYYTNGSMPYELSMMDRMAGMSGNYPLANGTIAPHLTLDVPRARLRLLNGANGSIYMLGFADERIFHQIASDGGLLANPVAMTGLTLAPGERAEILVDVSDGRPAVLRSLAGTIGGMGMMTQQSPAFDFLQLRPAAAMAAPPALPETLADLPVVSAADATGSRRFLLEMGMGMGMMSGSGFTINGVSMDMARVDQVVPKDTTEIWEIVNAGPMAHPFHVHNTQFRILDRNGQPPAPNEAGRKDTVLVYPGETVRVLLRFEHYTDPDRPYMFHCHILEHEDAGMMGQFTVI